MLGVICTYNIFRTLVFLKNNFDSTIPEITLTPDDNELIAKITTELQKYIGYIEKLKLRDALKQLLLISSIGNSYIQAGEPWKTVDSGEMERSIVIDITYNTLLILFQCRAKAGSLIGLCANIACLLSVMMQPYMPAVSQEIQDQLKVRRLQ